MDIISAYREVGTYRGAARSCGTTHKTVKRVDRPPRGRRCRAGSAAAGAQLRRGDRAGRRAGREVAGPDLGEAAAADRPGGRLRGVGRATSAGWSRSRKRCGAGINHRGRRPAVWSPGEYLVIDWGVLGGLHVFCAVLAWSRWRFVRFAADERADTTLALLAECFEALGGVPGVVLADRMGCLKGGVVANVVVPTADYVRFAAHYGFRPGLLPGRRPGIEGHRGEPGRLRQDRPGGPGRRRVRRSAVTDVAAANAAAAAWCAEVNAAVHSEICAVPAERLVIERELLAPLPSLRASIGAASVTRKVDRLSCVRFGSARYSVPTRLIGAQVRLRVDRRPVAAAHRPADRATRRGRRRAPAGRPG